MSVQKLSDQEIHTKLLKLQGWVFENGKLSKNFIFKDFISAFAFMSKIAQKAEEMNHHPDWFNSYRKVLINLSTHEVGGISRKDFDLAELIDEFSHE